MTNLNRDFRTDGGGPTVNKPTTAQALAQFDRQNGLCSVCSAAMDPSGDGIAVDYGEAFVMQALIHQICKAEIEAAKDQEWLNSADANKEREELLQRGFSPEAVEVLLRKSISKGIELWLDEDGNLLEMIDGEIINMIVAER
jgi:hypothetical protein